MPDSNTKLHGNDTEKPQVAIVVPSRNAESVLPEFLLSLQESSFQNWMAFLIDDASEDSTTDIIRDWCNSSGKGRPILLNKRHGPPGARNVALRLLIAEGYQLVLFHDSDCVLEKNTVAAHIAAHSNSAGTGIIGGPVKSIHSTRVGAADGYASWFTSPPGRSSGKFRFLHLPTCNLSVKTWVFDKTGLFQENLVTGEDVVFCQAARAAGVDISFAAGAACAHKDRDDLHDALRHHRRWGEHTHQSEQAGTPFSDHLFPEAFSPLNCWRYHMHGPLRFLLLRFGSGMTLEC